MIDRRNQEGPNDIVWGFLRTRKDALFLSRATPSLLYLGPRLKRYAGLLINLLPDRRGRDLRPVAIGIEAATAGRPISTSPEGTSHS